MFTVQTQDKFDRLMQYVFFGRVLFVREKIAVTISINVDNTSWTSLPRKRLNNDYIEINRNV